MVRRSARGRRPANWGQVAFVLSLAVLFLIVVGGIGYAFYYEVRELVAGSDILPGFTDNEPGEGLDWAPGRPLPPWEGTERVNILVLGIDERESEEGPWRTDTMLVLTVDPLTRSAGMLSIPRDLWVPIPGYSEGRINTANYVGDAYDYPGGGPALAMRTVQYNLGVPIHYYVCVNFRAFVKLVDLIGGIDVHVEEEINDPTYPDAHYGYDPLHIDAGWQHMDGELALKYARTRHSSGGDFDRARRQQQVLLAILDKVTRLEMLPQLIPQAAQLWQTLSDSVQTDLTLDKIVRLANLATQIPQENIRTAVIDERYTEFYETPDGQQVLIPVRDRIRQLRDYIFTTEPEVAEVDPAARLAAEAATVRVLNGTAVQGLARSTAGYLQQHGISNVTFGNTIEFGYEPLYQESFIYLYSSDKAFSAETVAKLLSLRPTAIVAVPGVQKGVDIEVILGGDYQPPGP